jgi:uncharacterized protein (DUF2062 family)
MFLKVASGDFFCYDSGMDKIKKFFKQFFLIDDTPHKIAAGAALGIFLGIAPGEGVASTLILASLLRFNRLSATAGVLATNMWGTVVVLPLAAAVGGFLFKTNGAQLVTQFDQTYHLGLKFFFTKAIIFDIALPLIVGFFAVAGVIAVAFYGLIFFLIKVFRKKSDTPFL